MKIYNVKEASEVSGIPIRSISYLCNKNKTPKKNNVYQISEELLTTWIEKRQSFASPTQLPRNVANDVGNVAYENVLGNKKVPFKTTNATEIEVENPEMISEEFTKDEYQVLTKITKEYPVLQKEVELLNESLADYRNQISYLQNSLEKQRAMVETSMHNVSEALSKLHQQNYIEAKNKGFDVE